MRNFVYLDTNILNSFLSQIYGGLVTKTQQETSKIAKESHTESSSDSEANQNTLIKFPFIEMQFSEKDGGASGIRELSKLDYGRELQEKVFHDNAVQNLIDNLRQTGELVENKEKFKLRSYVLFDTPYNILDIESINSLFNGKAANDIVKLLHMQEKSEPLNKDGRRSQKQKEDQTRSAFNAVAEILPCKQMLFTDDLLIPVTAKFLRESLQSIKLKYGGKIKILGYIGNEGKYILAQKASTNFISQYVDSINAAALSLLSPAIQWIVTPIALFFE